MKRSKRKILKGFIKAINKYNKGKNPKKLKVYKITNKGVRIPIIDKLEYYEG